MNLFFHVALDLFGAECLGRLQAYLEDVGRGDEHHFFVWGGCKPPPQNGSYWNRTFPGWDHDLWNYDGMNPLNDPERPYGSLDLDRCRLARDVVDAFGNEAFRGSLSALYQELPLKVCGNRHFHSTTTISCSLGDPMGSAILLGFVSGFAQRRHRGTYMNMPVFVFAGMGADSSSVDAPEEQIRRLAAQGLRDLEDLFQNNDLQWADLATPIYLAGDAPIENVSSNRATQVTILAQGLLALTRCRQGLIIEEGVNPFHFSIDADRNVHFVNDRLTRTSPFSILGAFNICTPSRIPCWIFAARFCREYLALFMKQEGFGTLEKSTRVKPTPELSAFLEKVIADCASLFWDRMDKRRSIPWLADERNKRDSMTWFHIPHLRLLYSDIFSHGEWEKLVGWYTYKRFSSLPLEDWEGALNELEEIVQCGFMPSRRRHLEEINRIILLTQVEALDEGASRIFAHAPREPVDCKPHEAAQTFLGRVRLMIKAALDEVFQSKTGPDREGQELEFRRRSQQERRDRLLSVLKSLPSPAAVIVRLIPLALATVGLGMVLPLPDSVAAVPWRLSLGLASGIVLSCFCFWSYVSRVKRKMLKHFDEWFNALKTTLVQQDVMMRNDFFEELLDNMNGVVEWYFTAEDDKPPLPEKYHVPLRKPVETEKGASAGEVLTRKTVLSEFKQYLGDAMKQYGCLEQELRNSLFSSYAEVILPGRDEMESHYSRIIGDPVKFFLEAARRASESGSIILPFQEGEQTDAHKGWRRSFLLPDSSELLDAGIRGGSSAFAFLSAVYANIAASSGSTFSLSHRIREILDNQNAASFGNTEPGNKFNNLCRPSMESPRNLEASLVMVDQVGGVIAGNGIDCSIDGGGNHVALRIRVAYGLSAEQVIFYPNMENPVTPLGRACRNIPASAPISEALKPVNLREGNPCPVQ